MAASRSTCFDLRRLRKNVQSLSRLCSVRPLVAAGPALADSGAPGTTFPEQPGSQPQTACAALVSKSGALSAPRSETAFAITNGLFGDACFRG
jgi:hypothetical protein